MDQNKRSWKKEIGKHLIVLFLETYLLLTSVFVVHKDMVMDEDGSKEWQPHDYWKMKILSMHKDTTSGDRWIVGTWFYSPSQLRPILKPKERY